MNIAIAALAIFELMVAYWFLSCRLTHLLQVLQCKVLEKTERSTGIKLLARIAFSSRLNWVVMKQYEIRLQIGLIAYRRLLTENMRQRLNFFSFFFALPVYDPSVQEVVAHELSMLAIQIDAAMAVWQDPSFESYIKVGVAMKALIGKKQFDRAQAAAKHIGYSVFSDWRDCLAYHKIECRSV